MGQTWCVVWEECSRQGESGIDSRGQVQIHGGKGQWKLVGKVSSTYSAELFPMIIQNHGSLLPS